MHALAHATIWTNTAIMQQRSENTCPGYGARDGECGKWKDQDTGFCYECFRSKSAEEGRICECGNFKRIKYPTCLQCRIDSDAGRD